MDPIFDKPDWTSTAATMQSLQNGAARIGKALARSLSFLPGVAGQQALSLLTTENLWTTAVILAFWIFASVIGGPVGLAVNGILIALALYQIPELAKELGTLLKEGLSQAASARSESDLDDAAKTIARLISTVGVEALQIFVTHRVFVMVKPRILKRFRVPKEIEAERMKAKLNSEAAERSRKAETAEAAKNEAARKRSESATQKARQVAIAAAEVAAAGGVKPAADLAGDLLPTVGLAAIGLVGVGTVVAVAMIASKEKYSGR